MGAGAVAGVEGCVGELCGYVDEKLARFGGGVWAVGEMQSADVGFNAVDAGKASACVGNVECAAVGARCDDDKLVAVNNG